MTTSVRSPEDPHQPSPLHLAAELLGGLTAGPRSESREALSQRVCALQAAAARCRVTLFLEDGGVLRFAGQASVPGAPVCGDGSRLRNAPRPWSIAAKVLATGEAFCGVDDEGARRDPWWHEALGAEAICAVPLLAGERSAGVMVHDRSRSDPFSEEFLHRARGAAADASAVLAWQRVASDLRVTMEVTAASRRLLSESASATSVMAAAETVARLVRGALHTEYTIVFYRPDPSVARFELAIVDVPPEVEARFRTVMDGMSLASSAALRSVASSERASFVEDIDPRSFRPGGLIESFGITSYFSLPLITGEGQIGHIFAGDVSAERRHWRKWEREFVNQLADEAILVLEGARLREQDRHNRERLLHQASHDSLTELPNRRAFGDYFDRALERAAAEGEDLSVLLVDLDRFKAVNDTLGHHRGDALLVEVARAFGERLGDGAFVARLGGDEFAAILTGAQSATADALAAGIEPLVVAACDRVDVHLDVGASVGIARYPVDGVTSDALLQAADLAMYAAKRGPDRRSADRRGVHHAMVHEAVHALDAGELFLCYQPKVKLSTLRPCGVEALVRWRHPREGVLGPDDFLPLLLRGGRMPDLTRWVLRQSLEQLAAWRAEGLVLELSVNVTAEDVLDTSLAATLEAELCRLALPPTLVTLEITEHSVVADLALATRTLGEVRSSGVRVSLDDFGTGYSSLHYLERLPIDEVKVDREFVRSAEAGGGAKAILRAIVDLGHDLGLGVVAEGVETDGALGFVRRIGCDFAQGYIFAPALDRDELAIWHRQHPSRTAPATRFADIAN